MEERISKLNGLIKYGSGGERGFSIFIKIPLEVV
jgi:signal transduction histidine kinase